MAPHSSTLAWKIPWTEEPGRLQSMGFAKSWTRLSNFNKAPQLEKAVAQQRKPSAAKKHKVVLLKKVNQ